MLEHHSGVLYDPEDEARPVRATENWDTPADEAQMLPVPCLGPCISAIAQLVKRYGASAVLCTATQPALDERICGQPQTLCIVNSRKNAQTIYSLLGKDGAFHLSTLMHPAHRKAALAEIRAVDHGPALPGGVHLAD